MLCCFLPQKYEVNGCRKHFRFSGSDDENESRSEPQLQALVTLSELKVLGEIIQVSVRGLREEVLMLLFLFATLLGRVLCYKTGVCFFLGLGK